MNYNLKEVAERLKAMREIMDISVDDICEQTGTSKEDYALYESGEKDFSVTFVYKCAEALGVDLIELLTGENPKLKRYCVVRKGTGLPMKRRESFEYQHLAYLFKNKGIEPFLVTAPFSSEEQDKPIMLSSHAGQEFDYVLEGSMKLVIGEKIKTLGEGDAIIYDSSTPHGMIAVDGKECRFLAILIKKSEV